MIKLKGKGAYGGIAIGKAVFFRRMRRDVPKKQVEDTEAELLRFCAAKERAAEELRELCKRAVRDIGESGAQIFEIHEMLLFDDDLCKSIEDTIRIERVSAEYAVMSAAERFSGIFSSMDDPYMSARAADIKDIGSRLCRILSGESESISESEGKIILCADDLAPSETMQLDKSRIAAFLTAEGSVNSHTAILARSLCIPAVVGVGEELFGLSDGMEIAVDSTAGLIYGEPDGATLAELEEKRVASERARSLLETYKGRENVTLDGRKIDVYANIQSISEVGAALLSDAGGIGLFRSEFLYLDRLAPPSEEEQLEAYKTVLGSMGDKRVIIRTLDIGADKRVPYLGLASEENPALGLRGIRISLSEPDIFRTQLRALIRAASFGRLGIMFPMISSVSEVDAALTFYRRVCAELRAEGKSVSDGIELGIMIETPAAAVISDRLAPLVDFFSVGTNDLGQYTMAIDRQNRALERFFDPHHEALLRLIRMAAENAHRYGKWIGVCGELGADISLTEEFLRMGIDELSVSPPSVLVLRERICSLDLSK